MLRFEWDPAKARANLAKHHTGFDEAATVFYDPLGITISDPEHSGDEDRYITIGVSKAGKYLMIAHTDRNERIRIISARKLSHKERDEYENEVKTRRR